MKSEKKVPNRLYKYRDFSNRTLDMVISDKVFFADPSNFNDPLDSRPSLDINLSEAELEEVLRRFVERRINAEMTAAARTIKYRGPKTKNHIKQHSRRKADRIIEDIEYRAMDTDYDPAERQRFLLGQYIEGELLRQYDKGIVSLAERVTCPLMWSHYGDQHRGICISYSVPAEAVDDLHKVKYGGSRLVEAKKVADLIDGDDLARRQVDEAVLLRKATSWGYEREWRLIGPRGLQNSPLELEEIFFGMRCNASAKYAVVKALEGRDWPVKFYEMREVSGTFKLRKYVLRHDDELFAYFPKRSLSVPELFEERLADRSTD